MQSMNSIYCWPAPGPVEQWIMANRACPHVNWYNLIAFTTKQHLISIATNQIQHKMEIAQIAIIRWWCALIRICIVSSACCHWKWWWLTWRPDHVCTYTHTQSHALTYHHHLFFFNLAGKANVHFIITLKKGVMLQDRDTSFYSSSAIFLQYWVRVCALCNLQ